MVKGIDVSHWQGPAVIPDMVKYHGTKYVMIRAGHGLTKDTKCPFFVGQCEVLGLDYGFYWYYEGASLDSWKKQTELFIETIKDYSPTLPVAIDYEEDIKLESANQNVLSCGTILENEGYFVVVYSNKSFFKTLWNRDVKKRFAFWLADYQDNISKEFTDNANIVIHQTSDSWNRISVDTDEFSDSLKSLCAKVKVNWVTLYDMLKIVEKALIDSAESTINLKIHKNGDKYRL